MSSKYFNTAMRLVDRSEGGYVKNDGGTGYPAIFGINKKWWKNAFNKALHLNNTQGEAAGKEYAKGFYKKHFYERYGIDRFPLNIQPVLLDGAVNHRSKFVGSLIDAAHRGAGYKELIGMRRAEYHRLARGASRHKRNLKGWLNRLKEVKKFTKSLDKNGENPDITTTAKTQKKRVQSLAGRQLAELKKLKGDIAIPKRNPNAKSTNVSPPASIKELKTENKKTETIKESVRPASLAAQQAEEISNLKGDLATPTHRSEKVLEPIDSVATGRLTSGITLPKYRPEIQASGPLISSNGQATEQFEKTTDVKFRKGLTISKYFLENGGNKSDLNRYVKEFGEVNGVNPNKVFAGRIYKMPPISFSKDVQLEGPQKTSLSYKVKKGDTLSGIFRKLNLSESGEAYKDAVSYAKENGINPRDLKIGAVLTDLPSPTLQ